MDKQDKKGFGIYTIVLFLGSIFSILGIGAVIPFIHILIQPEKIMALSLISRLELPSGDYFIYHLVNIGFFAEKFGGFCFIKLSVTFFSMD